MQPLKRQVLVPDVTLEHYDKRLLVKSGIPLSAVSSAIYNGGRQEGIRCIFNFTVNKGYCSSDPIEDLRREASRLGLPERTIGLMTAVDVKNAAVAIEPHDDADDAPFSLVGLSSAGPVASREQADGTTAPAETRHPLRVAAVVTAGISNAWRAGVWPSYLQETAPAVADAHRTGKITRTPAPYRPGTINIIVLVEGQLSDAALVNAVMTVTEAKTAIFYERDIRCPASGRMATGTTTDAVVVAMTGRGEELPYAGPGTVVGALMARAVSRALNVALDSREQNR
ncbi:adenosylcobinamide amidohydrolase [Effusibacillus pohliae]|uniref:adenosylcobinamide amidohydrolase n=1 Tax=Effusibacillus pohliae TaxID=232270 RepID=UPI000375CA81|nr:adenosylcobinamide amidohydrolase [Effusibacillus pohliae]